MTAEDDAAVAAERLAASALLDASSALLTQIRQRIAALRAAADLAVTDRVTATTAAITATTTAAQVRASTPALSLAYVTAIRGQIGALWQAIAGLEAWRAQIDQGYALAVRSVADLSDIVAHRLES